MTSPTTTHAPPRRRWYQYGLRTLLLLMLAAAVFFGWLGSQQRAYRSQRQALDKIEKLGAEVTLRTKESPLLQKLIGKDYVQVVKISFHDNRKLKGDGLAPLSQLLDLRQLSLHGCTNLGDAGLRHLRTLTGLQRLSLHGTGIKGPGLVHLRGLTELRTLSLQTTQVGEGLKHLAEMKKLEELNLTYVRARGPVRLASFPRLRTLKLSLAWDITRLELADLPKLEELDVSGIGAKEVHVARLPRLTEFAINLVFARSERVLHLEDLPNVETVRAVGVDTLRLRGLPRVKSLSLHRSMNAISDEEYRDLGNLSRLEDAEFRYLPVGRLPLARWPRLKNLKLVFTGTGDEELRGLKTLRRLETLVLTNAKVTEATLKRIRGLSNLRQLHLMTTKIGDAAAEHIRQVASLEELDLYDSGLTDRGLSRLMGLPRLRRLSLQGNPVTCVDTPWDLPRLEYLSLPDTKVTNAALQGIATLPRLRELSLLRNRQITDAGMDHLKGRKIPIVRLGGTSVRKRP